MIAFTKIDARLKMSESETHVFFWGGPFSQWNKADMKLELPSGLFKRPHKFNCCEQYMMASKAVLFEDYDALLEIMVTNDPSKQKSLGRSVRNFNEEIWNQHARDIVFLGNLAKFSQNAALRETLRQTNKKEIVEGSPRDAIWGVKLAYDDPMILDPANWRGANWLGESLMRVRQELFGQS